MSDEQLWDWVKRACNLHPNAPIVQNLLAQFRYVALSAVHEHIANQYDEIEIDEWNGLTDRQKLVLIKHAPDWTTLQLIEETETMLRINNA